MARKTRASPTSKLSFSSLIDYKTGNLGAFMLGIFYLLFPWFTSGILNETMAIFGLMFITIAVMRAKGSNTVLGGFMQAFIGIVYILALAGIMPIATLWIFAIILTVAFFILEMGYVKFGPTTQKADAFQIVPFTLMTVALLVSIIGYSNLFIIDWGNLLVALNYVAVFLFCALSMFQVAGWNIADKKKTESKTTNKYIMLFAVAAVITAVAGTYQGTLFQWV